jgi:hypothetical protein
MTSFVRATAPPLFLILLSISLPAQALNVPSDGSDGAFAPSANVQIDLSQAVTGNWNQDNAANAGKGIYDPNKWAVVFKYSSVDIPGGVTVTFKNHPSGAPVVWFVQGDTNINANAVINIKGADGNQSGGLAEPGPGGFRGGSAGSATAPPPAGFGPGGGSRTGEQDYYGTGSYATRATYFTAGPVYGNSQVVPLIGGSGGCGVVYNNVYYGGGAGGGAIMICSGGTLTMNGTINADGGTGHGASGSGGAIRLIAETIISSGAGRLYARGPQSNMGTSAGLGRIRTEANTYTGTITSIPGASITSLLSASPVYWPPTVIPSVSIAKVGEVSTPSDPWAVLSSPDHFTTIGTMQPTAVEINAVNVPEDWNVVIRIVPFSGPDTTVQAAKVSGDASASVWSATIAPKMGVSSLQVRAYKP